MKHIQKSVLLSYTPQEMFQLVADVPQYSAFLPWCPEAKILQQHDDGVTAQVFIAIAGIKQSFTTRNEHEVPSSPLQPHAVHMSLVSGPFSSLKGGWRFTPLHKNEVLMGSKVDFELDYAFSSLPLQLVLSPIFDRIIGSFVEGFIQRAKDIYGPR